jgi:GNAT superfamily N-acetyltransferase
MNAEAKASIDKYPCRVDFAGKEAYAGDVETYPKYQGQGLHLYAYYKIYDFLREKGINTVKSIVEVHNTAAMKAHERFAPEEKIVARGRYLRIMGLHFWRESPVIPNDRTAGKTGNKPR